MMVYTREFSLQYKRVMLVEDDEEENLQELKFVFESNITDIENLVILDNVAL